MECGAQCMVWSGCLAVRYSCCYLGIVLASNSADGVCCQNWMHKRHVILLLIPWWFQWPSSPCYSYHEKGLSFPLENFVTCIKDIAALDASGYADLSEKSNLRASDFSIEKSVDLYLSFLRANAFLVMRDIYLNMPEYLLRIASCFALGRFNEKKLFSARY